MQYQNTQRNWKLIDQITGKKITSRNDTVVFKIYFGKEPMFANGFDKTTGVIENLEFSCALFTSD